MVKVSPDGEVELLAKIAGGDQRAFKIIYDQYYRKIYTFCLRQLKSVELAEEVLQETFLKVWLMEDGLLAINNIEAYMRTIARNRCYDYIRKQERDLVVFADDEDAFAEFSHNETEESIMLADTRMLLEKGVAMLPKQQQLVYQLCHAQGLKYDEAGKELNISPLTVKNHLHAALRFLRNYMQNNSDLAVAFIILKLLDN